MYAIVILTASLYLSMAITYNFIPTVIDTAKVRYVQGLWNLIKTTLLIATGFIAAYLLIDFFIIKQVLHESFQEPAYHPVVPAPYREE